MYSSMRHQLMAHGLDIQWRILGSGGKTPMHVLMQKCPPPASSLSLLQHQLQTVGDHDHQHVLLLIGNTKHMWPAFVRHLQSHGDWLQRYPSDPLDAYIEWAIQDAFQNTGRSFQVWYAHRKYASTTTDGNEQFIPFQWLCRSSGLAPLHERSGLCVHPHHGPWFALRALVLCTMDGSESKNEVLPPPSPTTTIEFSQDLEQRIGAWMKHLMDPERRTTTGWQDWLKLRQMVAEGVPQCSSTWQYTQDQVDYHYTKDPRILHRLAV